MAQRSRPSRSARLRQREETEQLAVPETRLPKPPKLVKGVAEALQQGNLKVALKRSEAILERHPSSCFCKALRAVALELAGRRTDALQLCREVRKELQKTRTTDASILSHLRMVYQRANLFAEVTGSYDEALSGDPNLDFKDIDSEELGVSLFMALASEVCLQREQQVAMKLYRRFQRRRYLLWAVNAILLQAPPTLGPHRSLDLAHALLQRTPVELTRLKREGASAGDLREAHLLLLIHLASLRQQAKYSQAMLLLDAHEEGVPLASDVARLRLQLLAEADSGEEPASASAASTLNRAVEAARSGYLQSIDQWASAKEYIAVSFRAEGFLFVTRGIKGEEPTGAAQRGDNVGLSGSGSRESGVSSALSGEGSTASEESSNRDAQQIAELPTLGRARQSDADELLDFAGRTDGAAKRGSAIMPFLDRDPILGPTEEDGGTAVGDTGSNDKRTGHEVHDAFVLFKELQQTVRDHGSRTPFLAELEMRALSFASSEQDVQDRAAASNDPADYRNWPLPHLLKDYNDFVDIVAAYFERHGHRGGCYAELKPYLCLLDEIRAKTLLQRLRKITEEDASLDRDSAGDPTWVTLCGDAQRRLTLARLRRGLRSLELEGAALERMAKEVDGLLEQWNEFRQVVDEDSVDSHLPRRGFRIHGLQNEARPTIDVDDLLCLAAATLLDMDRVHCTQVWPNSGNSGCVPSLRDRTYIVDALVCLELGVKVSPHCARIRLLLAAVYGAVGAALPLRKWYDACGLVHSQREGLAFMILDRLLALGSWKEVPDVCKSLRRFHWDFEHAARSELGIACEESGTQSFIRSREYISALETMQRSVLSGRAVVEEAVVEVCELTSCRAIADYLKPRAEELASIANKEASYWVAGATQDYGTFQVFYALPRASPLQALRLGILGAPHIACPPGGMLQPPPAWKAAFRLRPPRALLGAAAASWPNIAAAPSTRKPLGKASAHGGYERRAGTTASERRPRSPPPLPVTEPSALEELLTPRREGSPGVLRLRALLLLFVHAILRREPSESDVTRLLHDFQEALAAEGLAAHCDPAAILAEKVRAVVGGAGAGAGGKRHDSGGNHDHRRVSDPAVPPTVVQPAYPRTSRPNVTVQRHTTKHEQTVESTGAGAVSNAAAANSSTSDSVMVPVPVEIQMLSVEDSKGDWPPPWRPALIKTDDLFWRCSLLACDIAYRMLQTRSAVQEPTDRPGDRRKSMISGHMGQNASLRNLRKRPSEASEDSESSSSVGAGTKVRRPSNLISADEVHEMRMSELLLPPAPAAWAALIRGLTVLRLLIRECGSAVMNEPSPQGKATSAAKPSRGTGAVGAFDARAAAGTGSGVAAELERGSVADDAKRELEKALSAIEAAKDALDRVSEAFCIELKAYTKPHDIVVKTLCAVMILLGKPPSWIQAKQELHDASFAKRIKKFDKDSVSADTLWNLRQYTRDPDFQPKLVGNVSDSAAALCMWVHAIYRYAEARREVQAAVALSDITGNAADMPEGSVGGSPGGDDEAPAPGIACFQLGGHGVQALTGFLMGPLLVAVPMLTFLHSRLVRPLDAVKTAPRPAQEVAAEEAFVALVDELQAVLKELRAGLLGAQWDDFDHLAGVGKTQALPSLSFLKPGGFPGGLDPDSIRRAVLASLVGSQRKQLASLEHVVVVQIDLVRGLQVRGLKK